MDIERLRKIIEFSDSNKEEIETKIRKFYSFVGIDNDRDVLNISQIARKGFYDKGYLLLDMPISDREIGALTFKGDAVGYILINSLQPQVNRNFAICHEMYHVFFRENDFRTKMTGVDTFCFQNEEYAANLFAGMLLMPEDSFRNMYHKFYNDSKGDELSTLIQLMHYFEVPYMAALIRCYELELSKKNSISKELLEIDMDVIRSRFESAWLDVRMLEVSGRDDYSILENALVMIGGEYVEKGYLNQRTFDKAVRNMRTLYSDIKGE